jgi:uncharacterized membrane protein
MAGTTNENSNTTEPKAAETKQDEPTSTNSDNVHVMAALAYIIFFLPLITHPESKFGKFHANQGLVLLIFAVVGNFIGGVIPIVGWFVIWPIVWLTSVVFAIMGIVGALNKEMKRLPLIGNYDLIK